MPGDSGKQKIYESLANAISSLDLPFVPFRSEGKTQNLTYAVMTWHNKPTLYGKIVEKVLYLAPDVRSLPESPTSSLLNLRAYLWADPLLSVEASGLRLLWLILPQRPLRTKNQSRKASPKRFIQAVFDDVTSRSQNAKFGKSVYFANHCMSAYLQALFNACSRRVRI